MVAAFVVGIILLLLSLLSTQIGQTAVQANSIFQHWRTNPARFVWICCWFVLEICHPELLSWMYLDVFWHFICCCKSGQTITIVGQQVSIHYNSSISRPGVHPKKAVGSPSYLACLEVGFSFFRGVLKQRFTSMKANLAVFALGSLGDVFYVVSIDFSSHLSIPASPPVDWANPFAQSVKLGVFTVIFP